MKRFGLFLVLCVSLCFSLTSCATFLDILLGSLSEKENTSIAAPTGVATSSSTASSITVSWNSVSGVSTYRVYYGTSSTIDKSVYESTGKTTFTVDHLDQGTNYYFAVAGCSSKAAGKMSSVVSGKTTTISSLLPPSDFRSADITTNSATLSWSEVANANKYEIYMGQKSMALSDMTLYRTVTTSSCDVSGLSAGSKYYFRIIAVNGSVKSPTSVPMTVTTKK